MLYFISRSRMDSPRYSNENTSAAYLPLLSRFVTLCFRVFVCVEKARRKVSGVIDMSQKPSARQNKP